MLIYHFLDHFHHQSLELRVGFLYRLLQRVEKTGYQPETVSKALALYQGCDEDGFRSQKIS